MENSGAYIVSLVTPSPVAGGIGTSGRVPDRPPGPRPADARERQRQDLARFDFVALFDKNSCDRPIPRRWHMDNLSWHLQWASL